MKRWGCVVLLALTMSTPCHGWYFSYTEEPAEFEEIEECSTEASEKMYGYLRGGAAYLGSGCLIGLAAFGVISPPVGCLSLLLMGMGTAEIQQAYEFVDYSCEANQELLYEEVEDAPLWEAVDRFGWQVLMDKGLFSPESMREKFLQDTEGYPLHEIEHFYSIPAIVAQGFLREDENGALMQFHRQYEALQKEEERLRETLSCQFATKIGEGLCELGVAQPWTSDDFIFFKITREKISVAYSEDLHRLMQARGLSEGVDALNREVLEEAASAYAELYEKWFTHVEALDANYLDWRDSIPCD